MRAAIFELGVDIAGVTAVAPTTFQGFRNIRASALHATHGVEDKIGEDTCCRSQILFRRRPSDVMACPKALTCCC